MASAENSLLGSALKKLKRNKSAIFGISIILIAVFAAIFAYFISPDGSPDANRMIIEIGGSKAGSSQLFLREKKDSATSSVSIFKQLVSGRADDYRYIPVNSYRVAGDSVIVQKYIDEGVEDRLAFHRDHFPGEIDSYFVSRRNWLGTDKYGRDILSRLILGTRVSLAVGLISIIISVTLGVLLGALAGYLRGWVDDVIMWLINIIWSIPTLLLVFAITLLLGKGFWQVFIAVGLTMWVSVARIVRGQILGVRELEYVEAARALGFSTGRIIFKHILPNVMGPVLVVAASNFASAIVIEAGLSFLGVGVQPPQPSWGLMIKENYNFIITHNPMLALAPGFAIMLLVLAFNLLGNALRDALNVREIAQR